MKPPNAGKGRPKGAANKVTKELKEMILRALDEAHPDGGIEYLKGRAKDSPTAFLSLVGKVLPMTVTGTGENGEINTATKVVLEIVGNTPKGS